MTGKTQEEGYNKHKSSSAKNVIANLLDVIFRMNYSVHIDMWFWKIDWIGCL